MVSAQSRPIYRLVGVSSVGPGVVPSLALPRLELSRPYVGLDPGRYPSKGRLEPYKPSSPVQMGSLLSEER